MKDKDKKLTVTITREQFVITMNALSESSEPHNKVVELMQTLVEQARENEKQHPSEDEDEEEDQTVLA
jgi:hypothetical protein